MKSTNAGLEELARLIRRRKCSTAFFRRVGWLTLLSGCVAVSVPASAEQRVVIDSTGRSKDSSSINCGLFAVKAAAAVLDTNIPVEGLFGDARYLSSPEGSTGDDLLVACKDFGLAATSVSGLTSAELRVANCPILINLPVRGSKRHGGHWMAVLGQEDGLLRVYDNLSGLQLKLPAEIDLFWDGSGIAVNVDDETVAASASALVWSSLVRRASWAAAPVLLVFLINWALGRVIPGFMAKRVGMRPKLVAGVAVASLVGLIYAAYPMGSLASYLATRGCIDDLFASGDLKKTAIAEQPARVVRELGELEHPLVVDVRRAEDYRLGAIPGAISVPINATTDQWVALADELHSGRPVVLYCQSAACSWASICQARLDCMGVPAFVYAGGYARYQSEHLR